MRSTVVFLHGLFQGLHHLRDFPFPAPHRGVVLDLLGYGEYAAVFPPASLDAQVAHVLAELDRLELRQPVLAGHSVGGAIAMLAAAAAPGRLAAVVNIEGNFTLTDAFWSAKVAEMTPGAVAAMLATFRADPAAWLRQQHIAPTDARVRWTTRMLGAQAAPALQALARAVVAATRRPEYLATISRVPGTLPVHLMAGERSQSSWAVPPEFLAQAKSLTVQPGAGHMMQLEDPPGFLQCIGTLL
jgi:lipase